MNEKYQPQKAHKVLSKYSENRWSVGEIEYYYNEVSKYWKEETARGNYCWKSNINASEKTKKELESQS